jgi:tRNA(adenine34) deaminase
MIPHEKKFFMQQALEEAQLARDKGEVPVGAVAVYQNQIISRAHNEVEQGNDATLHAEILALRRASAARKSWRMEETSLYVTLEPCSMCAGAMVLCRLESLYFGAWDPRQGAVGSLFDLTQQEQLPHKIRVYPEFLAEESGALLKSFFAKCRNKG